MARRIRNEREEKNQRTASGIAEFLAANAACTCETLEFCTKLEIHPKKSIHRLGVSAA